MTTHPDQMAAGLPCDGCGYDLRAHPQDGTCPECGASVAEARRLAGVPRRPAWRDSDPRWRRRMLAGVWVLVLVPLKDVLEAYGWAAKLPVPTIFGYGDIVGMLTLDETFLFNLRVYSPLVFCIGIVLLFSKERGRPHGRLDWTRRWGVLCSYAALLLSAASVLYIVALVVTGIAALFVSLPLQHQPEVTTLFSGMSRAYLLYGPHPKEIASFILGACSSITVLLACVPLFNALRSSGPRWAAALLLVPLALSSLMHLLEIGRYCLGFSRSAWFDYEMYFVPELLVGYPRGSHTFPSPDVLMEFGKWGTVLVIAIWLSIAQLIALRQGKKARIASPAAR